jgi:hypothetical protein
MATEIIFNGKIMPDNMRTWDEIRQEVSMSHVFSGAIDNSDVSFLFKNVKSKYFDYYLNEFKKLKNNKNNEVKFEIQTNARNATPV